MVATLPGAGKAQFVRLDEEDYREFSQRTASSADKV